MAQHVKYVETLPRKEDYFELFLTTGWNDEYNFSRKEAHQALQKSWHYISVYDQEKLVGFGRTISDGIHHALIVDLMVHPDYQKLGIGTRVLETLLNKCTENRIRDIQLFSAKGKADFYKQYGFENRPDDAPGMHYKYKESF